MQLCLDAEIMLLHHVLVAVAVVQVNLCELVSYSSGILESANLLNTDIPQAKLYLTTSEGAVVLQGTYSKLRLREVTSVQVVGDGCYKLFKSPHFRRHVGSITSDDHEVSTSIYYIKSIEYFLDSSCCTSNNNDTSNNNRIYLGGALGVSAVIMIVVLLPTFKETYLQKTQYTEPSEAEMEMNQGAVEERNNTGTTKTTINYTVLWSEIVNWRANIEKREAQKTILLGLLPSAFDVSTDYSYARTWDDQGFNPQIRALVYFFICLPHAVAIVTAVKMGIFRIFTCSGSKSCLRTVFPFFSFLAGLYR